MEIFEIVVLVIVLVAIFWMQRPLVLWLKAAGVKPRLSIKEILTIPKEMDKTLLVDVYIMARISKLELSFEDLKIIYKKDPKEFLKVVSAQINEKKANESSRA